MWSAGRRWLPCPSTPSENTPNRPHQGAIATWPGKHHTTSDKTWQCWNKSHYAGPNEKTSTKHKSRASGIGLCLIPSIEMGSLGRHPDLPDCLTPPSRSNHSRLVKLQAYEKIETRSESCDKGRFVLSENRPVLPVRSTWQLFLRRWGQHWLQGQTEGRIASLRLLWWSAGQNQHLKHSSPVLSKWHEHSKKSIARLWEGSFRQKEFWIVQAHDTPGINDTPGIEANSFSENAIGTRICPSQEVEALLRRSLPNIHPPL